MTTFDCLGGISTEEFIASYWQRRPLLIRQAIPNFTALLDADEIAGLALEPDVESRLIVEDTNSGPWQLRHGPFTEPEITALPENGWSLLIQGVDTLFPEFHQLLKRFRFLPSWRLDDIMISLAPDGGSVGPHFDYYDVFLLQASGQRLWKIGDACDENSPRVAGTDLRILSDFNTREEWLLEPGDMLYLPPKIAHWGIARSVSSTYSIGFRAPKLSEIISEYCDYCLDRLEMEQYFSDPQRSKLQNAGEISSGDVKKIQAMINSQLNDTGKIAEWFGRYVTRDKTTADKTSKDTASFEPATLDPSVDYEFSLSSRRAYYQCDDSISLFIDGRHLSCTLTTAKYLCKTDRFDGSALQQLCQNSIDRQTIQTLLEGNYLQPV